MSLMTNTSKNFCWIVIASLWLGNSTEISAELTAPVATEATPAISRLADDRHYLVIADLWTLKIPVVQVRAEVSSSGFEELLAVERLGEFKIGSSAASILTVLGPPQTQSPPAFSEHDARYHQSWRYPKQGITFGLVADSKSVKPEVDYIRIVRPATLATRRGIKIGDSFEAVVKEYGRHQDKENSILNERFVAGSIYGGLVFSFQDGRVAEIFLGAAAE